MSISNIRTAQPTEFASNVQYLPPVKKLPTVEYIDKRDGQVKREVIV